LTPSRERENNGFVEYFDNGKRRTLVATVNFSVPEDVKRTFNRAFAGVNKSAVIAQLMRQAVEDHRRQLRRRRAIERLLRLRRTIRPVSAAAIRAARVKGRP
jgi:hypothetical protein